MWSEQAIAAKMERIQSRRLYPEDEQWIRDMLALVGQRPEHAMSKQDRLTHNERVIRDFMNGEGIFAGEQ